jgi:hypothetical protein
MADRSKVHKFLKHLLTVFWVLTASLALIIARTPWSSLQNLSVGNAALGCGARARLRVLRGRKSSWHGRLSCQRHGSILPTKGKTFFASL